MKLKRTVKFEADRDPEFARWISHTVGGERIRHCLQCGLCSGSCPLSLYMDYTPRRLMHLSREGFKEEVLNSLTIWLCASCYSCYVQCPRQIHITDIMYALKREAISLGFYPRRLPIPVLAREFYKRVLKDGRNTESWLLVSLYLRTNPFIMVKESILGLKLFLAGRMSIGKERVRRRDELHTLLRVVDAAKGGKAA